MKITLKDITLADITPLDTSVMDRMAVEIGRRLASEKDAIIRSVISGRIGADWKLDDVIPRLRFEQERGHPETMLLLDDKPLITMWPAECKGEGAEIKWVLKYKEHTCNPQ